MLINILYLLSVLMNIETYIAYYYSMAHPDMRSNWKVFICIKSK